MSIYFHDLLSPAERGKPRYMMIDPYLQCGTTRRSPLELLQELQRVEDALGRERLFANVPRTIDLDLLFHDALVLATPQLRLPHPRLHQRFFVLVPLAELAPDLRHPRLGLTVRELLLALGEPTGIRSIGASAQW
jgi:2-amino-4-hydroxy-6-hydroxymethyldihydropteridine diphosphokinase